MLALKRACKRLIRCFHDDTFPDPLPELCLRRPELLTVAADNQRRAFLLFLLFLFDVQLFIRFPNTLRPSSATPLVKLYKETMHTVPRREASYARRRQIVKTVISLKLFVRKSRANFPL